MSSSKIYGNQTTSGRIAFMIIDHDDNQFSLIKDMSWNDFINDTDKYVESILDGKYYKETIM